MSRRIRVGLVLATLVVGFLLQRIVNDFLTYAGIERSLFAAATFIALTVLLRGRGRDLMLALVSLSLGVCLLDAFFLLREAPGGSWDEGGMHQTRAFIGFGPGKPGVYRMRKVDGTGRVVFDAKATIGDNLLRVSTAPSGEGAVGFFGDSFTFGVGIPDGDTIEQSFANLTRNAVPVPNLAFSGWSPAQSLAILQHDINANDYRQPRRFVLSTAVWHVERTACKVWWTRRAPRYDLRGGKLVQNGYCYEPGKLWTFLRGFATFRDVIQPRLSVVNQHDIDTYFGIVDEFVRLAKSKYNVGTTILAMPDYNYAYPGLDRAAYIERLKKSGADVIANTIPTDDANHLYTIEGDGHPTGLANRLLARLLVDRFHQQGGLLPDDTATAK